VIRMTVNSLEDLGSGDGSWTKWIAAILVHRRLVIVPAEDQDDVGIAEGVHELVPIGDCLEA